MEADILKSLKFELGGPTIKTFLRHVCFIDYVSLYVEWYYCFCILAHISFSFSVCRRFITKVGLEGVDVSYLILQPIS